MPVFLFKKLKMSLIKLSINGISYSQTQTGAYALILSEVEGSRKLPIIIAKAEAQSIAIALEDNIKPPRPLTHDLFKSLSDKYEIALKEVIIHKLVDGVFHSSLVMEREGQEVVIDSRTSDAVALAIRFNAPIFSYKNILDQAGMDLNYENDEENKAQSQEEKAQSTSTEAVDNPKPENKFAQLSTIELEQSLHVAIEEEDYEKAAIIRDELEKRKK